MTAFTPQYRVKINESILTGVTLSGMTITSGRTDIYSQPLAGYCNLTLIETNLSSIPYEINDTVTVEVKDSTNAYIYLFGGTITDVNVVIQNSGSSATTQKINVIAVGALAKLSRAIYTNNFAHEFEGTRIYNLIASVLLDSWNDVAAAESWATYSATTQWQDAESQGFGDIDTPGDYELHSQTGINDTVYNLASFAANSGLGYLYEDAQGRIGYADSTHRNEYLTANGYVDLDGNHAIGPALQISKKAGDVRNSVTISYGADQSSEITDSDPASISLYGLLSNTIPTALRHQSDAELQAEFYLSIRAYPRFNLKQITFPLANSEIDDGDRDSLLNVFMGMPVNIANLPINMVNGQFQGFVEGWTWTAALGQLNLTMNVSPLAFSLQSVRWNGVSASETWNTLSSTLSWLDATIVA